MNVSVSINDVLPAVRLASEVAKSSSTSIPILGNVLVVAEGDTLRMHATDYEMRLTATVPARVEEPGETTFPAGLFHSLLSTMPEDSDVSLGAKSLTCGEIFTDLATMPAKDFPKFEPIHWTRFATFKTDELSAAIDQALECLPTKDPRRILLGVHVEIEDGKAAFVGTDGKIMSMREIPITSQEGAGMLNIPKSFAQQLSSVDGPEVTIYWTDKCIMFKAANLELISNQIEGKYPAWRNVVPATFSHAIELPRQKILSAIKRAKALSDPHFTMDLQDFGIKTTAEAFDKGAYRETISHVCGATFKVTFDAGFLSSALKSFDGDTVVMHANRPETPVVFGDGASRFLIMPIKVAAAAKEVAA